MYKICQYMYRYEYIGVYVQTRHIYIHISLSIYLYIYLLKHSTHFRLQPSVVGTKFMMPLLRTAPERQAAANTVEIYELVPGE